MEEDKKPTTTTTTRRKPTKRLSIKKQSDFNNYSAWKHELRENCFKRVREDRTHLLWKMRSLSSSNQEVMTSAFEDIVSDELKKFKDSLYNTQSKGSDAAMEGDDLLWEYGGLRDAYEGDCEEMLLEMQRIFYEDLEKEPTCKDPDSYFESWEDEEDEYLARSVFEHMRLNDEQAGKETWCPICKQGELKENHKHIYCTLCQLQLCKGDEVNLEILQTRLADAHAEHLDRGCKSKPKFCLQTRFGLTALYISCQSCDIFEVVM